MMEFIVGFVTGFLVSGLWTAGAYKRGYEQGVLDTEELERRARDWWKGRSG